MTDFQCRCPGQTGVTWAPFLFTIHVTVYLISLDGSAFSLKCLFQVYSNVCTFEVRGELTELVPMPTPRGCDLVRLACTLGGGIFKGPQVILTCMKICSKQLYLWKYSLDVLLANLF